MIAALGSGVVTVLPNAKLAMGVIRVRATPHKIERGKVDGKGADSIAACLAS